MLEKLTMAVICGVALLTVGSAAQAIDVETEHVGNPGNAADSTGYGSVGYAYNIGTYEVTAGQYCEFLNAVATTDAYGLLSLPNIPSFLFYKHLHFLSATLFTVTIEALTIERTASPWTSLRQSVFCFELFSPAGPP